MVAAVDGGVRGRVRVGIMRSLALGALSEVLVGFHSRRLLAQVDVEIDPRGSADIVWAVQLDQLDVALVGLPDDYSDDVDATTPTREPLAIAVLDHHPLLARSIINVDCPIGWGIRQTVDRLFSARGGSSDRS